MNPDTATIVGAVVGGLIISMLMGVKVWQTLGKVLQEFKPGNGPVPTMRSQIDDVRKDMKHIEKELHEFDLRLQKVEIKLKIN